MTVGARSPCVHTQVPPPRPSSPIFHSVFAEGLVAQMVELSDRGDEEVKQICSTALNQVPPDMVELDDKMVKVLVSLLQATEGWAVGDVGSVVPEPSLHDLKPWTLRPALVTDNPVDAQPSWINDVWLDFEVSCFCASWSTRHKNVYLERH